jgi:hypothetical protein
MRPDDISTHIRKQPFRPLLVHLSDGTSYHVRHPDFMLVTRSEVIIALDLGSDVLPERYVYCDPVHITRIEPFREGNGSEEPVRR